MNTQAFTPEATQARIQHEGLRSKIMTAEQAAELIQPGFNVGMSMLEPMAPMLTRVGSNRSLVFFSTL